MVKVNSTLSNLRAYYSMFQKNGTYKTPDEAHILEFDVPNVPNIWHLAHLKKLMRMLSDISSSSGVYIYIYIYIYQNMI